MSVCITTETWSLVIAAFQQREKERERERDRWGRKITLDYIY